MADPTASLQDLRDKIASKNSVNTLRWIIIIWAVLISIAVWFIDNPYILAGIALYEMLP